MQDFPDEPTETMGDRPDRLSVPEPRDEPAIHELENAALRLDSGIGRLIEHSSHLAIPIRGAMAVVHARALLIARTGTDPRGEMLG